MSTSTTKDTVPAPRCQAVTSSVAVPLWTLIGVAGALTLLSFISGFLVSLPETRILSTSAAVYMVTLVAIGVFIWMAVRLSATLRPLLDLDEKATVCESR